MYCEELSRQGAWARGRKWWWRNQEGRVSLTRFVCTDFSNPKSLLLVIRTHCLLQVQGELSPAFREEGCVFVCVLWGGQSDLLAFAIFSNSFSVTFSICQGAIFGRRVSKTSSYSCNQSSILHMCTTRLLYASRHLGYKDGQGRPHTRSLSLTQTTVWMEFNTTQWTQEDPGVLKPCDLPWLMSTTYMLLNPKHLHPDLSSLFVLSKPSSEFGRTS